MATLKQIDANRRNAQLSTGPITPEGKQSSSQNALQSGIYAEKEVLPFEDPASLTALTVEYHERFQPTTPEARALVDSLIHNEWLLRRIRRAEASIYTCECETCDVYKGQAEATVTSRRLRYELYKFDHLQRRINQAERNYHRSLKALESLQPPPEPPRPEQPKATSTKLALFPQNDFPSDPGGQSSAGSVKKPESRTPHALEVALEAAPEKKPDALDTLDTPEVIPGALDTPPTALVPRHTEPIEPNPCD